MARARRFSDVLFRKLLPADKDRFEAHLLGLDDVSRRMRFGMSATDAFLIGYAERCMSLNSIIQGAFIGDELVGVAELRPLSLLPSGDAEIAFSVAKSWRNVGIGTGLFARVIRSARNRAFSRLYMTCIAHNAPMQALARKFDAEIIVDFDEAIGVVSPHRATVISLLMEAFDDASNLVFFPFLATTRAKRRGSCASRRR